MPPVGGDGPKWMCGIDTLPDNALVYSFGCNGDTQVEEVDVLLPRTYIYLFYRINRSLSYLYNDSILIP